MAVVFDAVAITVKLIEHLGDFVRNPVGPCDDTAEQGRRERLLPLAARHPMLDAPVSRG